MSAIYTGIGIGLARFEAGRLDVIPSEKSGIAIHIRQELKLAAMQWRPEESPKSDARQPHLRRFLRNPLNLPSRMNVTRS